MPGTTKLPRWKRRIGDRSDKVGGRSLSSEPHGRTVDVDSYRAVRCRLTGGRVDARHQVGPGGGQIEDNVLIDLPLVETLAHRLGGPQAKLRVPQWAVGVGMAGVSQGREITEHVEQVTAVA